MATVLETPPILLVLDFRKRTAQRFARVGPHFKETHAGSLGNVGDDMAHWGTAEGRRTLEAFRLSGEARA